MAKEKIDKRSIARQLYLSGSITFEEIAQKVGTTRQTISRWSKEDNWEILKASQTITASKIIIQLQHQIIEINNNIDSREVGKRFATPAEADALNKLATAIRKLEDNLGASEVVSVGMKFLTWLRPIDASQAQLFSNFFDSFINEVARESK